jgi:transposase-like protein
VIRVNGDDYRLCCAVDPETNKILQFRLFPTATKRITRWFLAELHRQYNLMMSNFSLMMPTTW